MKLYLIDLIWWIPIITCVFTFAFALDGMFNAKRWAKIRLYIARIWRIAFLLAVVSITLIIVLLAQMYGRIMQ